MGLFKTVQEVIYEKSPSKTFYDLESAFDKIGKIITIERENRRIIGKTKYGLNSVTIDARVEEFENKTRIIFNGKSGDINAIAAQNKIADIVSAMKSSDNPTAAIDEEKASTGKLVMMWIFAILGGIIGIAIASSIVRGKNADGSPKYTKENRTQATVALVVAICLTIIYFIMYNMN